jgi:hypothetical protein
MKLGLLLLCFFLCGAAVCSETAVGFIAVVPIPNGTSTAADVVLDRFNGTLGTTILRLSQQWSLGLHNRAQPDSVLTVAISLPSGHAAPLTDKEGLPFVFSDAASENVDTVASGITVNLSLKSARFFVTVVRLLDVAVDEGSFKAFSAASFITSEADESIRGLMSAFNASYGAPSDQQQLQLNFDIAVVSEATVSLSNSTGTSADGPSGLGTGVIVGIVGGALAVLVSILAYAAHRRKQAEDAAFTQKYGRPVEEGQSPLLKHYRNVGDHGKPQQHIQKF